MKFFPIDEVSVRLTKEKTLYCDKELNTPRKVAAFIHEFIGDLSREAVVIVNMNSRKQAISVEVFSMGLNNKCLTDIKEGLKSTILSNASSIIIGHNHPSGDVKPSEGDIAVTDAVSKAATMLNITLLDHVIVSPIRKYYSFTERKILPVQDVKVFTDIPDAKLVRRPAESDAEIYERVRRERLSRTVIELAEKRGLECSRKDAMAVAEGLIEDKRIDTLIEGIINKAIGNITGERS